MSEDQRRSFLQTDPVVKGLLFACEAMFIRYAKWDSHFEAYPEDKMLEMINSAINKYREANGEPLVSRNSKFTTKGESEVHMEGLLKLNGIGRWEIIDPFNSNNILFELTSGNTVDLLQGIVWTRTSIEFDWGTERYYSVTPGTHLENGMRVRLINY